MIRARSRLGYSGGSGELELESPIAALSSLAQLHTIAR